MSLALARKYRPSGFDELIGQEAVSQTLSLALDSDRLSHAYLFSGLRGSGKTSTARIFAKALLCEKGTTSRPCGVCSHCLMANEGRHIDIIEMDAASNRGIDDIKELIEHTKYKPASARYKIFIIDEVHMLTNPAFNALLKTLEEPPPFIKFILATTDPLKLPATILSRTQHFRFRKISQTLLTHHLEHILNLEKVGYESSAIEIIARSGAGSVRDALTLLDQAIVYSKNFIDIATVTSMLGIIEPSLLEGLIEKILIKDEKWVLEFIAMSGEFESEMVIDELILYLKELLLLGSSRVTPMIIERFFRVLAESKTLLNIGSDGEFVLTLTLFKMMESLQIQEIDAMIRSLEKELSGIETIVSPLKQEAHSQKAPSMVDAPLPIIIEEPVEEPVKIENRIDPRVKDFESLRAKIYDRNYELGECFMGSIKYISFVDNILTWESTANEEEKKMLRNNWSLIRMFVQEVFDFDTKIKNISKELPSQIAKPTYLKEPIISKEDESSEDESSMKSSCIAPSDGGVESAKEKDERTILDEPMVVKALELFSPKKVRVKRNN